MQKRKDELFMYQSLAIVVENVWESDVLVEVIDVLMIVV